MRPNVGAGRARAGRERRKGAPSAAGAPWSPGARANPRLRVRPSPSLPRRDTRRVRGAAEAGARARASRPPPHLQSPHLAPSLAKSCTADRYGTYVMHTWRRRRVGGMGGGRWRAPRREARRGPSRPPPPLSPRRPPAPATAGPRRQRRTTYRRRPWGEWERGSRVGARAARGPWPATPLLQSTQQPLTTGRPAQTSRCRGGRGPAEGRERVNGSPGRSTTLPTLSPPPSPLTPCSGTTGAVAASKRRWLGSRAAREEGACSIPARPGGGRPLEQMGRVSPGWRAASGAGQRPRRGRRAREWRAGCRAIGAQPRRPRRPR
jgi:hypothetical protein